MKYSFAALAFATTALAGQWPASNGTGIAYTTEIVTALTTYCPEATVLTHGGKTYTATASETLTITECPCTLTKPVVTPSTVLYTSCPPSSSEAASISAGESSVPAASPTTTYSNPLTVIYSTTAAGYTKPAGAVGTGTGSPAAPATTSAMPFTGAASANKVGALLVAVAGVVALAL